MKVNFWTGEPESDLPDPQVIEQPLCDILWLNTWSDRWKHMVAQLAEPSKPSEQP